MVYGFKGIKLFIEISFVVMKIYLIYLFVIKEIEEGIVFEDDQFIVIVVFVIYGVEVFGYCVQEKDVLGFLKVDVLKEMKILSGFVY